MKTIKTLSTFIVAAALTLLAETTYHEYIQAYFKLMFRPEYYYLMIILPIATCIIIKLLTKDYELGSLSLEKLSAFVMFLTMSLLVSATAEIADNYRLQLKLLSYALLSYGVIILIYKPKTFTAGILIILSILTLIPIQPSPMPLPAYYILTACAALSLYSINLTWKSKIPRLQKAVILLILAATVIATVYTSVGAAIPHLQLTINLATPNGLLTLAVRGAVIMLTYYLLVKYVSQKFGRKEYPMQITEKVRFSSLMILTIIVITYPAVTAYFTNEVIYRQSASLPSLAPFLTKFTIQPSKNNITILKVVPTPRTISSINQPLINISTLQAGEHYQGYLEIIDRPADFSDWHATLTIQGYTIIQSRTLKDNNTINVILAKKKNQHLLIGYALYNFKNEENRTKYARISIITYVKPSEYKYKESTLLAILSVPRIGQNNIADNNEAIFTSSLLNLTEILATANGSLLLLIAARKALSTIKSRIKRRMNIK